MVDITRSSALLRWTGWCLYALAAFQALIAVLLLLNWQDTVSGFTGRALAPTRAAAEGAAAGSLGVHVLLAALYVLAAVKVPADRRWARVVATVLLAYNVIGGIVTLFTIPGETPLNPAGVVLALAALILLWGPRRRPRPPGLSR
ncbi:hypothetical protein [Nonomuraea sp. NPDC049758]|uniref:hypothetical protein n=1 Tax=Nonomuraea sp. NPDC049758 TaxID=3154360 RepID=UPI00342A9020